MTQQSLTTEQFEDFRGIISSHLGIKMPPAKQVMLQSRLHRRLRELGLDTFEEYHAKFFADSAHQAAELEHLLNLATTNKTDFFREPEHFDHLVQDVVPRWRQQRNNGVFRVWCAGCSSGEEAYTIAMTLLDAQQRGEFPFSILATDVCTRVLETAQRAIYSEEHAAPIPPAFRARYVLRSRDRSEPRVRLSPEVRAKVRFGHLNFLSPDYGLRETMDVVFFRNVMIYFDRPTQQEVVGRMCRNLSADGTLYIAHAETLQGLGLPLRVAGTSIYRHQPRGAAPCSA